jgi:HisJ family histidinol phosphate phosphatase
MAHPDYWRKYLHFYGKIAQWGEYGSGVFDALQAAADNDVGIEVNTAGERAGTGHFYPLQEFLVAAHEAGIETVTVGSDSHTAAPWLWKKGNRMLQMPASAMSSFEKRRSHRPS